MGSEYFQQVVVEYLRSSRSRFVNSECLIQLDADVTKKQRHWYCDFMTIDFSNSTVYLCEVTFSRTLQSLLKRLTAWELNWAEIAAAIHRDCRIPTEWHITPWVFVPEASAEIMSTKLAQLPNGIPPRMPAPIITTLESVLPWKYRSWNGIPY